MVIVDTSVWVEFLRSRDDRLRQWIAADLVLQHPFVTAEIGMGSFRSAAERADVLELLDGLARIPLPDGRALSAFVGEQALFGTGIGFVDAHLLHACAAFPEARLVTRDARLARQAERLGFSVSQ